jgi:tripartite ATP-independent transporter DctM subunit
MEWYIAIILMFGTLVVLMATGMPISFAFMLTCIMGAVIFWGGAVGLDQLAMSFYSSVSNYNFLPIPLFVLMGDVIFASGAGLLLVDAVDKLLGRVPGRLSLVATGGGVLLGTMIGVSGGSIAILGQVLQPEMYRRGYKKAMVIGPIVSTGVLAILIPPSSLAVFLGAVGQVSVGKLLMAIIMPGLLLAVMFAAYIIVRCKLDPTLAPTYEVPKVNVKEKFEAVARHIAPILIVIFAVIGVVFLGIATPSEAAALGVVACYILAAVYGKFNWKTIKESSMSSIQVTVMVFFIVVGSISFARILATTGAISTLVQWSTTLPVHPMVIIVATQIVLLFLGCFMDPASIVMISAPLFFPIVNSLGYDPIWFAVISLINIQLGLITPPFGLDVFTMKALSPPNVTLGDAFKHSMPFLFMGFALMVLIFIFPAIATWFPSIAAK